MTRLDPPDAVVFSDAVFRQLSSATSGGLVCPQLRRLTWTSSYGWEPMKQFLSPHLTSVIFYEEYKMEPSTDMALLLMISLLPTTHLEDLNLNLYQPPAPIHSVLSEVVQRLSPCFKSLATCSSLSEAAWERLGSLPKLEWLRVSDIPRTEILKSIPRRNTFPALQSVEIEMNDAHQPWSYFFSLFESSPLREVTVTPGRTIQGVDIPGRVLTAMLEAELQRSVDSLTFSGSDPGDLTFLSYVGRFSSLKTLKCTPRCRWQRQCVSPLADSDIEQLASGLPQLVTVWLGHECKYTHHNTTIKSLISFSTHCPSLDGLCFPCDLTNISNDIKTESGVPDPRLEILSPCKLTFLALIWVVMPPPDDVESLRIVTSALDHLFPCFHPGTDWGLFVK